MARTAPFPYTHRLMLRRPDVASLAPLLLAAALLLPAGAPAPVAAQAAPTVRDGLRVGLVLGGHGLVGVSLEYFFEETSVDLTVGTWAFGDVSLSLIGKQYFGAGSLRPFLGGGLWWVTAFQEGGSGMALLLQAPVGADWRVNGDHYLGLNINVTRGLGVTRSDPDDTRPMYKRVVPFPGLYYGWLAGDRTPR